jgi:uncharacterized protein YgiM (DUF1202 family)
MKKLLLLCLFALTATFASAQSQVIVAGDNVCFRLSPDESTKLTGSQYPHVSTGQMLTCLGQVGNYYKVRYGENTYYIPKKYARPRGTGSSSPTNSVTPVSYEYIVIAGDNVCMRSQPNEQSKLVGPKYHHFNTGDYAKCTGKVGSYYQIMYNDSYYYIPQKYGRPRN